MFFYQPGHAPLFELGLCLIECRPREPKGFLYWGGWDEHIFAENYRQRENFIVWAQSTPVAYVALSSSEQFLRLEDLQVCPDWQGQGTWAIQEVERIAVHRRIPEMEVRVFHDNPASRLYRRLGFKSYKHDKDTDLLRKSVEQMNALDLK